MKVIGYPQTLGTGDRDSAPFNQIFGKSIQVTPDMVRNKAVDAIVIWGGADISPSIYKERASRYAGADERLSNRDQVEVSLVEAAIEAGVPIIGICRGAQLACAMAGGKLVQHVNGHSGNHAITTADGRSIITSSVHHQMMFPFGVEHELIAWSSAKRASTYIGGDDDEIELMHQPETPEPEIVFFPKIKALAVQGHPEFMDPKCEFVEYVNNLVKTYLMD